MPPVTRAVLNVGGNSKTIPIPAHYAGWRHDLLDIDPKHHPDIVLDARHLGTLPAGTYDAVYCAHNLEHYYRHDGVKVVQGFKHVLRPDGFVEIHVPDLAAIMRHAVEKKLDLDDTLYLSPTGAVTLRDTIFGYQYEIEQSGQDFFAHKTGFSAASLIRFMRANGFLAGATASLNPFELTGYFFKQMPTPEQIEMLRLTTTATRLNANSE